MFKIDNLKQNWPYSKTHGVELKKCLFTKVTKLFCLLNILNVSTNSPNLRVNERKTIYEKIFSADHVM